jgi:hypothetical protein
MSDLRELIRDAGERFLSDVAKHQLTVLHDDGMYRHLRFMNPKSSFSWFDLITWPGNLAIRGDHGGFMFARVEDMFTFFRARAGWNSGTINPGYWAEKLPDGGRSAETYSAELFNSQLDDQLAEYAKEYPALVGEFVSDRIAFDALPEQERWPQSRTGMRKPTEPKTPDELRELVTDYDNDGQLHYEAGARELLDELAGLGVVSNASEWDLRTYDFHYLWCCHAIQWGIGQYDAARQPAGVSS